MNDSLNHDLIAAAWRNDVEEATRLIDQGADVNATDESVQSAYLIATSEGFTSLLALILRHGADVTARDSYNGTGLIRAAERGHAFTVGMLIRSGIEIDHINNLGWTALLEAIMLGDGGQRYADTVRVLLAIGADPELPSQKDGVTPLDHATSRGFQVIATSLRAAIAATPLRDATGALFVAARNGDADSAMLALKAGANPVQRNADGETPLSLAAKPGHRDATRLLHAFTGPA